MLSNPDFRVRGARLGDARSARARAGRRLDSMRQGGRNAADGGRAVIVIVHGYEGSGEGHWQRWLAAELAARDVPHAFPDLPDPIAPQREAWTAALADVVARAGGTPVTFVCHSLGCWALDHVLADGRAPNTHAALLVAPPSPFLVFEPADSFFPPPRRPETWAPLAPRTLLVGSDNDEYSDPDELEAIARELGIRAQLLPGAGHINVASGHGPWPFALDWLRTVGALAR